jgi:hypothetical protein
VYRDQEQRDEELFSMSILRDYITYAKANFQVLLQKSVAIRFLVRNQCCGSALVSMRIRIWIRIQMQSFDDQKLEKCTAGKKFIFF